MSDSTIHERVAAQFAPTAAAYAASKTHGDKEALAVLVELTDPQSADKLLDIATGAGHTALAFAPLVAEVVAFDLTPSMLDQAAALAAERGLTNVTTVQGQAERLPFPDESFDIVTVRTAPHHFADVKAFVDESFRVLKPGGKFLLVDTTVPEDDWLDIEINRIELLRDPSHVRNYRASEWQGLVEEAGFRVAHLHVGQHAGGKKMDLEEWLERIRTSEANREQLRGIFSNPAPELVEALAIDRVAGRIVFTLPEMTLLATKPSRVRRS
ncbi:MAG TPA: methyltransferase domain-containing protein [Fimbriimonas sp.]|nr:methyltransferase domain-containing protein [Fimbriimonas sp.]